MLGLLVVQAGIACVAANLQAGSLLALQVKGKYLVLLAVPIMLEMGLVASVMPIQVHIQIVDLPGSWHLIMAASSNGVIISFKGALWKSKCRDSRLSSIPFTHTCIMQVCEP